MNTTSWKRWIGALLCCAMLLSFMPIAAFATENETPASQAIESVAETEPTETEPAETEPAETEPAETEPAETEPAETEPAETESTEEMLEDETGTISGVITLDTDLPENDELFALFVEQELYGYEMSTFGTKQREGLNAAGKGIYDALKPKIEHVALNGGSSVFALTNVSGLKMNYTNTELGVTSITEYRLENAFESQIDLYAILMALLGDCPFDLYWFDKTQGISYSYNYTRYTNGYNYTSATINSITFTLVVSDDYWAGTNMVTSNVSKITKAKNTAAQVAANNSGKTPYQQMVAFKEYICAAVTYNHAAVNNPSTPYGDPWQLIWVFDGDSSTNVVCEGYSKAFQYLCDLSGLDAICASGDLVGAGPHMWNVATLNSKNYLVDITNSDDGTVGQSGGLFLVGASYNGSGYSFPVGGGTVSFACENLDLSTSDYDPSASTTLGGTCGDNITWTLDTASGLLNITGSGAIYDYTWSPWYDSANTVKTVVISNGITKIGSWLFEDCYNMTSITLPNTLTYINYRAFDNCHSLTSIAIPASVSTIGASAFYGCDGLKDVYYGGSAEQWNAISIDDGNEALTGATIHYQNGYWVQNNGKTYYYENGVLQKNRWIDYKGVMYYVGPDGARMTNVWIDRGHSKSYLTEQGYMATNRWVCYKNVWYYVDANGYRLKDIWMDGANGKCYLTPDGYMAVNRWVCYKNTWYYVGSNGARLTNIWMDGANGKCYLTPEGYMAVNRWICYKNTWYYVGSNGARLTDIWVDGANGKCYLTPDGYMAVNRWICYKGTWYYVGSNGARITDVWVNGANGMCYLTPEGYMAVNRWICYKGAWYYVGENGARYVNTWKYDDEGRKYLGADGALKTNSWIHDGYGWCYVNGSGYAVCDTWERYGDGWRYLNDSGYMSSHYLDYHYHVFSPATYYSRETCSCGAERGSVLEFPIYLEGDDPFYCWAYSYKVAKIENLSYRLSGNKLYIYFDAQAYASYTNGFTYYCAEFKLVDEYGYLVDDALWIKSGMYVGNWRYDEYVVFDLTYWDGYSDLILRVGDYNG